MSIPRQAARTLPSSSARASERTCKRQSTSSWVMAAPLTVLATNSRMYCKAPNSEDLQRSQLFGKTTPKVSTPLLSPTLLRLRTEKFAVQYRLAHQTGFEPGYGEASGTISSCPDPYCLGDVARPSQLATA